MLPSTQNRMGQIWENRLAFSRESHQEKYLIVADHQKYF